MEKYITGFLAAAVAAFACVVYLNGPSVVTVRTSDGEVTQLGATPGPNYTDRQYFNGGATAGGRLATTTATSVAAYTLTQRDLAGTPSVVEINPSVNLTLSLSSTSTYNYVPTVGDTAKLYVRNASTTAAASITLAAVDTGVDLQVTKNATSSLAVTGLDWAELTLIRKSASSVTVIVHGTNEAD